MRLLSKQKQDAIINNLVSEIPLRFDFLFSSTQVEVITGKQEGVVFSDYLFGNLPKLLTVVWYCIEEVIKYN